VTLGVILLTHTDEARALYYGERAETRLNALGVPVRLNRSGRPLDGDALIDAAQGARIIIADRAVPAPASLFAALPDLVAFVRGAVDIRTVDVEAASRHGVLVTRASPGFDASVCELVLGLMVDLARGVSDAVLAYRAGRQPPVRMGRQIAGATVGVIGYGGIGRRLARLLLALEARVLVSDPYADIDDGPEQASLPALLAQSDYVVCAAIANAETANLLNAETIGAMKSGAFLINISRGELLDDAALADALDRGHLAGAALDVGRAPDQMPAPALAGRPDVIATPHIGGLTRAAADHQALETVRQAAAILRGEAPEGSVNPDRAARLKGG
jgi:D-3-phosphoglycerate dehydrogenase / 2-oxoglutarate reductase